MVRPNVRLICDWADYRTFIVSPFKLVAASQKIRVLGEHYANDD
jgi:hypothetical protein